MTASPIAISLLVGAVVFVLGTVLTMHFGSAAGDVPLDIYKIGGMWLIVGAVAGRIVHNAKTGKSTSGAGS